MNIIHNKIENISIHSVNLCEFNRVNLFNFKGTYICLCSTHMFTLAYLDQNFKKILNQSSLTLIDGRPLFWLTKILNKKKQFHNRGIDTTKFFINLAINNNMSICFFGSTPSTLRKIKKNLKNCHSKIKILNISPPFGNIPEQYNQRYIKKINDCKIDLLFVALGCPKQEHWMYKNSNNLNTLVLGVGAAINYLSRDIKQPPKLIIYLGLEWLIRLFQEPKRLFLRYFKYNILFILISIKTIFKKLFFFQK